PRELVASTPRRFRRLVLVQPRVGVDRGEQIARDRQQPLRRDPLGRLAQHLVDADREGLGRVYRMADLGGITGRPVCRAVEADVRRPAPEEAEDALALLLR